MRATALFTLFTVQLGSWGATGDRVILGRTDAGSARPPPPPLPNPCWTNSTGEPQFHVTNMGTGPHDANAILKYKGMWHVFHQANWTDWAHLVSTDMARWTRLPSALTPNGDWDGSLTVLGDGNPVIMYDCYNIPDCHPTNATPPGLGDPRIIGVAHPVDPSDPNLTKWKKDPNNPISINNGTLASAGPSALWEVSDPSDGVNMVMQLGRGIGRFESTDPKLHNWTLAEPDFFPSGGNGAHGATGVAFYPLAGITMTTTADSDDAAAAVEAEGGVQLTHFLEGIWGRGKEYQVGCPWVYLGHYDQSVGRFVNSTAPQPIDFGLQVMWSTIDAQADGRILHVGWFNYGVGALTVPRSLTYDPKLAAMLSNPVAEIETLRGATLGSIATPRSLPAGGAVALFGTGKLSTTYDLVAEITLPAGKPVAFGLAVLASSAGGPGAGVDINVDAGVLLNINVSAPDQSTGARTVDVSASVPHATAVGFNNSHSFQHPDAAAIELRVLVDRMMVEAFVGGGRGVVTTPVLLPGKDPLEGGAFLFSPGRADSAVEIVSATAWEMGCGWASYPYQ